MHHDQDDARDCRRHAPTDMADRLAIMHVSRAQTIHHPAVHGLARFADLPEREQREILSSPEWIRIASVRDPVSRAIPPGRTASSCALIVARRA